MPQPAKDGAGSPFSLVVYARRGLIDAPLAADDETLLLEGAWDGRSAHNRWSLDRAIDGRFDWIDRHADARAADLIRYESSLLANALPATSISPLARAAGEGAGVRAGCAAAHRSPLWLAALELRYHLVKLLRLGAFFDHVRPLSANDRVQLVVETPRDTDYVDLLTQHCHAAGAELAVRQIAGPEAPLPQYPPNRGLRRWLGAMGAWLQPATAGRPGQTQVVLCGNPRVLDPLVGPLREHGAGVWWLYDRFALRSFLAWRWRGVGQLVCNSSQATDNVLQASVPDRVEVTGVDLAPAVRRFADRWLRVHGPRQSFLVDALAAHFHRVRPAAVVLDEDATPWARAVLAAARDVGARSLVVQHGAPCCRFGFAPLAADEICVWGRASRSQLLRWDVPENQVRVTGSPYHDRLRRRLRAGRSRIGAGTGAPRLLMFATVPPRDERPDALAIHWTRTSYADVLRASFDGALRAGCREMIVKLHPRAGRDPILDAAIADHPRLAVRLVRRGRLERLLRGIDCVLSCGSSAGIDATLSGIPVIQVLPTGASDFLSREPWGLAGTARTADELRRLLAEALSPARRPAAIDPHVFSQFPTPAADRIVAAIFDRREQSSPVPEPHSSFVLHPSSFR